MAGLVLLFHAGTRPLWMEAERPSSYRVTVHMRAATPELERRLRQMVESRGGGRAA